jgi:hypothetical protein
MRTRFLALASTSVVVCLSAFTGTASATSLDVTIPCGCHPLHAFAGEQGYTQSVGDAVGTTPAVDNPSGTAGNANNSSGLGLTGNGLIDPSGSASFS